MSNVFMNTYQRLPVTFASGEGSWLFDTEGKKYLDLTSGIAVSCLGHNNPALVAAISEQAGKICHVCNYYQNTTALAFAQRLVKACSAGGMQKVFLANSGAEANEGACKIARKYSLKKYGTGRHTIVTLKGSFHGRTITTLSATGQEKFHKNFGPFTEGFKFITGGDIAELDKALDAKTVAGFFMEVIQGESGIVFQSPEYIAAAAKFCAERDILLMFDEIQCGLGRTGSFLAYEQYVQDNGSAIKADIVTLAKGLCGGIPAGAVLAGEKTADVFEPGDHGSTFGGNPVAAAAGLAVLNIVDTPEFLVEVKAKGELIMSQVKAWNHPKIKEVRGRGLMVGIDVDADVRKILEAGIAKAANNECGLLLLSGGASTVRLLPPYTISKAEIEQGLEMLKGLLN